MTINYTLMKTAAGTLKIEEDEKGICAVNFTDETAEENKNPVTPLLKEAVSQLTEYFEGSRRDFELPLSLQGTEFQVEDWKALCTIPYGETRSYKQIAEQIGRPKACRAVGMANHNNPISIIVPCHRVIGANGSMVGYGGGLDRKTFLLALEKRGR